MSPRVLIVDDEPLIAHNLQSFLEDEGMEACSVGSAEQALEALRGGDSYDICVMDLRLPGMDGARGIVVLHTLCPTLRFIIHTGSYNYALSDELRAIGIEERHLLRKPLADMGLLAARVRELAGT